MVLDEQGRLGVKTVTRDDRVQVSPVSIIGFDADGAWVDGLPPEVELITLGGGFVQDGQAVQPVPAEKP